MNTTRKEDQMTDEDDRSLNREELEGEEAVELPDREAMSIIASGSNMLVPPTMDSGPMMPTDPAK
jgi:hypothetical protein